MKTTKKVVIATLIGLAPLGLFADGHDGDDKDDKKGYSYQLIKDKGVNLIFEGEVKSKPKSGLNGIWNISDKEVIVDDTTIVVMDDDKNSFFKDYDNEVEVFAKRVDGKIKAILIKGEE